MNTTYEHLYRAQVLLPRPRSALPRGMAVSIYGMTAVLAITALHLIISAIVQWGQTTWDDIRYGRPRTMHLYGFVGHDDAHGIPSHFIAMNLNRQVVVLEIPGGNIRNIRSYLGPYLFGIQEALTPVHIELTDKDRDGLPDLLVRVNQEEIVYLNRDGAFRLPEPAEQVRMTWGQAR